MPIDVNDDPRALAAQNSLTRAVLGRMLPQNMLSVLGSGLAGNAASAINGTAYRQHVAEMMALGQTPLTPEQFAKQQGGQ